MRVQQQMHLLYCPFLFWKINSLKILVFIHCGIDILMNRR